MTKILLVTGAGLILIGLLMGIDLEIFANAEIALDAHVAAIQHGMLLMIIGLAWRFVSLNRGEALCAYLNIAGLYGLWIAFIISAFTGEQFPGGSSLTNIMLLSFSAVLILGMVIFIYGLVRQPDAG